MESKKPKISVVLPCRNEERGLLPCLQEIKKTLQSSNLAAEIIVSDSSRDKSPEIAKKEGAILIKHDKEGYGMACLEGFKNARGDYIFMADADASYSFKEIPSFIKQLEFGYDMVIGNRFSGKMRDKAMTFSHRYIGNPILSFILRLFFGTKIRDSQCGMRAIKKNALQKLNLQTTGMEFASEMIVKALKNNLRIKELPIDYFPRIGKSKMRSLPDAWKHIRFMLLYSPLFLFFAPGSFLFLAGIISMAWLYFGAVKIGRITFSYHPMFFSSLLILTGYQLISFAAFAKVYSITHLKEESPYFQKIFKHITIEKSCLIGGLAIVVGFVIFVLILFKWINSGFGALDEIKNSIVALTLMAIGAQTIFSSFMLSILGIKEK